MRLPPLASLGLCENPTYTIEVNDNVIQVDPSDILSLCWTDGLDTPCSVCLQHFDIAVAPPVRTLQLKRGSQSYCPTTRLLPTVVVTNTHLICMKVHNIHFTPISHAWHDPVARAYASRETNLEAARMVFELPVRVLLAAAQRYGRDIQIWHDYISIPQWQDSFRGTTILPQIFQIFKYGGKALIHLDDEPTFDMFVLSNLGDIVLHSENLKRVFNARWFRRMWIIVEFLMCRDGYLMNSRYEIMSITFTSLIEKISQHRALPLIPSRLPDSTLDLMTSIPLFSRDTSTYNCLGHVYDLLANQGCRSHRDRFIATSAILEQDDHSSSLAKLPWDTQEACLYAAKRALQRNDYSPLLLRPAKEPQYGEIRWLRGHTAMEADMWELGVQMSAAHSAPTIMPDDSVQLELQSIGLIDQTTTIVAKETTTAIPCPTCRTVMSCQLSMWQAPKDHAVLYCIPGLLYAGSGSASVGIIVDDSEVIGRASFAKSVCDCAELVTVRII
ncbi:hypothetical protein EK21DRAFT_112526 [Setomelanomma holmii]|uniref:Heterokaryon incompatibility domain-containing protein n=1 Tax=Setomelanomma holmii TaxID=210430 RepID=A0A9P4LK20_9PLEO|nr:hypothetical protein EK21DRAFT_112526 [Setomelanomma holmii]